MYEQRRPDVAVFVDFENVYVSVRDKLNANPNFEAIMDRCGDLGRVVISRAYADWYRYPRVTSALYANAIEPIYVATYYYDKDVGRTGRAIKNSVDMNLCIDAMKTLFTNPNIGRFVLVTGDRDFIPLVNSIRQQGKEVYIIGIGGAASTHLAQSADEFVFYEQLVGRQTGGSATATAIANRSTELSRGLEPATESAQLPRDRETPPREAPTPEPAESDIYTTLIEAIHLVRKRGYVSTLGSIKLVMKELLGGDFKESRYRDLNGRSFAKFKDFVVDAEKRGKVQIFTNGTVNEVFLPGEDPYKLSQFAAALSEEAPSGDPLLDTALITNGRKGRESTRNEVASSESAVSPAGRRRRRRSRRGQGGAQLPADTADLLPTELPDYEEPDYTAPVDDQIPAALEDDFAAFETLETSADPEAGLEEQLPFDLDPAGMPADLLAEAGALEETAAALGLVDLPDLPADESPGDSDEQAWDAADESPGDSDEQAWDAAAGAVAAEQAPPGEDAWDAVVVQSAPPDEEAWEATANALVEEQLDGFAAEEAPSADTSLTTPIETAEDELQVAIDVHASPEGEPEPLFQPTESEPPATEETAASTEGEPDAVAAVTDSPEGEEEEHIEPIAFSDEEWAIFTGMMSEFPKPASFQQIFDTLRGLRKEHGLARTNEQLRTMVKQAINNGLLERSGRGKRVYYTLHTAQ
jgi:uncharacterized protein (TIGR00288 family)